MGSTWLSIIFRRKERRAKDGKRCYYVSTKIGTEMERKSKK